MKTVYLDQNKWLDLSRAHHGEAKGQPYVPVLQRVVEAVKSNAASFPLRAPNKR
jgi:hypothetical protein